MNSETVEKWLHEHGQFHKVITLDQSAATAQQAADALDCDVSQIAKSLVFYNVATRAPILIIASGANRVDKAKVGKYLGYKIKTAGPEFVEEITGFPPGAVPPFAHKHPLATLIDAHLLKFDVIWAAAGDSHAVFQTTASELITLTGGQVTSIH